MKHQRRGWLTLLLLLALCWGTPALAQQEPGDDDSPIEGLLQGISATSPQAAIGDVIEDICPSGRITSADLQARCNEVVGAALEQQIAGARNALQAMAPEENAAVGSSLVDTAVNQIDRVGQRIETVRAGARGGASFSLAVNGRGFGGPTLPGMLLAGAELQGMTSSYPGLEALAPLPTPVHAFGSQPLRGSGFSATPASGAALHNRLFSTLYAAQDETGSGGGTPTSMDVDLDGRWGFFFSGSLQTAERDSTDRETGFDLDGYGVTVGLDRTGSRSTFGGSLAYETEESDLKSNSGRIDSQSVEGSLHASWFPTDTVFVDLIAGAGQGDLEQDRVIAYTLLGTTVDQVARGETDFDQLFGTLALGWDLGGKGGSGAWQVSPEARVEWLEVDVDGFSEVMSDPTAPGNGLGLEIDAQSFTSLTGNLGLQIARAHSTSWGVLLPAVSAEWVHEFEDGVELLTGRFLGDPTDETYVLQSDEAVEDYGRLGASLTAVTAGGGSFFVQVLHLVGYDNLESTSFSLGGRLEF